MNKFWNPDGDAVHHLVSHYDSYEPHWNCLSRERIPTRGGDGPKWVCGVDTLNKSALVYSFGSQGDTQFEDDIQARVSTDNIFIFDPSKLMWRSA